MLQLVEGTQARPDPHVHPSLAHPGAIAGSLCSEHATTWSPETKPLIIDEALASQSQGNHAVGPGLSRGEVWGLALPTHESSPGQQRSRSMLYQEVHFSSACSCASSSKRIFSTGRLVVFASSPSFSYRFQPQSLVRFL